MRQRGTKVGIITGTDTVRLGKDFTIVAVKPGYVKFWKHPLKRKNYIEVCAGHCHQCTPHNAADELTDRTLRRW